MATLQRIATAAWREGRFPKAWALFTALPGVVKQILDWFKVRVEDVSPYLPEPAWWWGLIVLLAWALFVIYSLARKVVAHETPVLQITLVKDERDNSWWLEVNNVGSKALQDCAVNIERIENADGNRVFPHSFGLARPGNRTNPFPLRPAQPKQGHLAGMKEGRIVVYGMDAHGQPTEIMLEDDRYSIVVSAYSESEGAPCSKIFTLSRKDGFLSVS